MKAKTLVGLTAMLAAFVVLMAGHWSSGRAEPVASITLPPPGAVLQLYPGCNNIGLTFPNGTSSSDVIEAVIPAGSVETMWRHDAAQQRWDAFSPATPAASNLLTVNFLNAIWLCLVGGSPTPPPTATTPAGQTATPTPNAATATSQAGQTATPTPNAATATVSAGRTATPRPTGPTATPGPAGPTPTPGTAGTAVAPTDVLTSFRYSMDWTTATGVDAITIGSRGEFQAPDRVHCAITMSGGGTTLTTSAIVIGDHAWVDGTPTPASEVAGLLKQFCPGYGPFWEGFLPLDLGGIQGQTAFVNGVWALRLSLVGQVQSIPMLEVIPPGATLNIWVAQSGGWLVALQFDATVDGEPIRIRVDVTNPNASITVNPP